MLSQSTPHVNRYLTVVRDGQVYRWQRYDGRTIRTSSEAFVTLADANGAAVVVAACYGVPCKAVRV